MNEHSLTMMAYVYLAAAVLGSIMASGLLERRFRARNPGCRPYRWGHYVGCMGLACAMPALVMLASVALATLRGQWELAGAGLVYAIVFATHSIAGWFVLRRRRWAWVLATVLSCNVLLWVINGVYGKNRWAEFGGPHPSGAGDSREAHSQLENAVRLEAAGRIADALAAYRRIVDGYPGTEAAGDAQASINKIQSMIR